MIYAGLVALMLLWDAVRVIQPVSLTRTHIYYHPALLKGAPTAVTAAPMPNERRLHFPMIGSTNMCVPQP